MKYLLQFLLLFISTNTNAALIETDWELGTTGNTDITTDTGTGLEWLDLTITVNISKEDMLDNIANDPTYFGWRYATYTEWQTFSSNAGINPSFINTGEQNSLYTPIRDFLDIVGTTFISIGDNNSSRGLLANQFGTCCAQEIMLGYRNDATLGDVGRIFGTSQLVYQRDIYIGHYLVREASVVPLPAAVWLFISGFIAITGAGHITRRCS